MSNLILNRTHFRDLIKKSKTARREAPFPRAVFCEENAIVIIQVGLKGV
jgi:hypothetical protein